MFLNVLNKICFFSFCLGLKDIAHSNTHTHTRHTQIHTQNIICCSVIHVKYETKFSRDWNYDLMIKSQTKIEK